jgi:hypothetical protein
MKRISENITIDAPPEAVWFVLTDFDRYMDWNPFISKVRGAPRVGAKLEVTFHTPGYRPVTLQPEVLGKRENRLLHWKGCLMVPGLFDGDHSFTLEPTNGNRTRLIQSETLSGLLVPLLSGKRLSSISLGIRFMNQALKERVENHPHKGT